jgi:hypothetical protein
MEVRLYKHTTEIRVYKDSVAYEMMQFDYGFTAELRELEVYYKKKYGDDVALDIYIDTEAKEFVFTGWKARLIKWLMGK